jgi:hypothetical protein
MAQSALTVTPESPTPPTNISSIGQTAPNPKNYLAAVYGPPATPPPFFDDGITNTLPCISQNESGGVSGGALPAPIGTLTAFAAAHALVQDNTGQTSVAHEGAGTEVVATKSAGASTDYGVNPLKYGPLVLAPVPMVTVGTGPAATAATIAAGPNASHASSLSPATNPALTSVSAGGASGGGTTTCTATGTNFTAQSVLNVNGINYPTTFTSPTTISCTAPKKATAGTLPVYVITGGVVQTATVNWTFT